MKRYDELYRLAEEAREKAYCPYSKISVGAALLCESGKIYFGANIENSAYSPSVCAERAAIFSAINAGERKFKAIAVAGGPVGEESKSAFPPCGVCRQVMSEFCGSDFKIIFGSDSEVSFSELLPYGFNEEYLK